jgi:membrane-bound serine protease (ClpP class)
MKFPCPGSLRSCFTAAGLGLLAFVQSASAGLEPSPPAGNTSTSSAPAGAAPVTVYVVTLDGQVTGNLASTLHDALAAVPAGAPVMLDLNIPGGDPATAVQIFTQLAEHRSSGPVFAYVQQAVGPGVLLLAAADHLYAPVDATLGPGSSAPGGSLPLPVDQLEKLAASAPWRVEITRAFFEDNFSLIIGDESIKKPGSLLTLSGAEAARTFGQPPQPLLVDAIAPTFDEALQTAFGPQPFQAQAWTADGFVPRATLSAPAANPPSSATPATPPALPTLSVAAPANTPATAAAKTRVAVYVVPINDEIDTPQLYILRRALKSAIENHVDAVVLNMDTPGGSVAVTLDMMDALSKFKGRTFTYVNPNAISGGSYIAEATNEIYFAPDGVMGAAAVVGSSGEDISETMKSKINSYLNARVRAVAGPNRYRADVQRAMMDINFEFKIGDQVIKPTGELLSLTAKEACQSYGDPPEPLLGAGIEPDINALLTHVYGADGYTIKDFHLTWSEHLAKWLNSVSAILLGAGILLLFIEFKASSFGVLGVIGVSLLLLVFVSSYLAGLAGYEPLVLFILGILLIALELFVFTGTLACGLFGALCFFGSFVWAMTDVWPSEENYGVSPASLAGPLLNVVLGIALALLGVAIVLRFLPKTRLYGNLINQSSVPLPSYAAASGAATATGATTLPEPGTRGIAMTDLRPLGEIEVAGGRYQARAAHGQIDRGATVEIVSRKDFALKVKAAK